MSQREEGKLFVPSSSMGKGDKYKNPGSSWTEADSSFGEPVTLGPSDTIDLHPFQPRDIPSVVEEYLEQCLRSGFTEVRLIHGKGKGIQRNIIRSFLTKHPAVRSFKEAPLEAGGWGATIVVLQQRD